ncbi:CaiB/BaiF CoA transferase family protein, partial [Chloroflexota bacterium]
MVPAFDGVKILDFSWVVAGPVVTTWMAQYGATVIRVESSKRPDTLRTGTPYKDGKPGLNRSGYFTYWNTNKYSIALNLKNPAAAGMLRKLVSWADAVVENFTPGQLEKMGFGYEDLKKINPDIILLRLSMYGQSGPLARHLGFGPFLAGLVGFQNLTGWPDRGPVQVGGITDFLTLDYAMSTLISALDQRNKTGEGQCIDLSQCEVALQSIAPIMLDYFVNGKEAERQGNSCAYAAPHAAFRCQGNNRWCAVAVTNEEEWAAFCNVLEKTEWLTDPRFSTLLARKQNETELNELITEWTDQHSAEAVMEMLQAAGVPAGIVATSGDLLENPQLQARDRFWLMEHPEMGDFYHLGEPFKFSRTTAERRLPSPCLGEHTELVCKEILKMSDEE